MERLRHIRAQAGYSQQELADKSGVSQHTVSEIELGRRKPQGRTLRKLADTLGVEVADFYRPRMRDIKVGEAYFVEPEEGEEPDIVTLRFYVWRELEKDDALVQKVARLVKERDKAKAG